MDINMFIELIGTIGFPIACVLALGIFVFKLWQQSVEREKTLMTEIAENRLVNEKAIETIAHYADRLDAIQADIGEIKNDIVIITTKIDN
jgi:hypothetical protein